MDLKSTDHLLTTTRSVRKRLDLKRPVEPEIIQESIEIAIQAPAGGGQHPYHFMVVTEPEKRASIVALYRKAFDKYIGEKSPKDFRSGVYDSAKYLSEHMHEVPVLIIACIEWQVNKTSPFELANIYGSILPAAWSLMLALRARGLGSSWTTLHLEYQTEVAEILGMPQNMTQGVLLPVAYFKGDDFKPARRLPGRQRTYWDSWGHTRQS